MLQHVLIIISEDGIEMRRLLTGRIPEHGIHRGCIYNFIRVENIQRIPAFFDDPENFVVMIAYHFFYKLTTQPSVTMFSAQRALIFFYQVRNFCGNCTEHPVSLFSFEIYNGSKMNFSGPCMCVMNRMQV